MPESSHQRNDRARLKARGVTALLLCAALTVACSSRSTNGADEPLRPDPAGADVVNGIEYRGELRVLESFPVQLVADVTLTNVSGEERTAVFPDGCVVLLRAYRGAERVWDQGEHVGCTQALVEVTLAPGESRSVQGRASAYDILRDELPDGRYRIGAHLRPDGQVVELNLGETDLAIPRNEQGRGGI